MAAPVISSHRQKRLRQRGAEGQGINPAAINNNRHHRRVAGVPAEASTAISKLHRQIQAISSNHHPRVVDDPEINNRVLAINSREMAIRRRAVDSAGISSRVNKVNKVSKTSKINKDNKRN
jgi:hypothetical protein